MIDHLNPMLVELLTTQAGLTPGQIGFQPPDQTWRNLLSGMTALALNVYLVELYQHPDLHSNELRSELTAAGVQQTRAPGRLCCRYLISAWSPAQPNPITDPTTDEDRLLYDVARVLMESAPLDAEAIYGPGSLPAGFPDEMLEPPLPAVVAPPEPFAKLADFWMRMDTIWRPVVELAVTLPVAHAALAPVPAVTTLTGRYGTVEEPDLEELLVIGGVVRMSASGDPVPAAWVRVVELDRTATTDDEGQFVFAGLRPGTYTLEAGAPGSAAPPAPIEVPTVSGVYDVLLS